MWRWQVDARKSPMFVLANLNKQGYQAGCEQRLQARVAASVAGRPETQASWCENPRRYASLGLDMDDRVQLN